MADTALLSGDAREDLLALWASFAPFSFVSLKFPLESIQRAEQDYFCGYGILEEDARYCGVCMDELVECFPASPAVHTILKVVGEDLGVQIIIQREDVFQYMYKI